MIGRENEVKIMQKLLTTPRSEMLAIIGRRRVGKTYLIKNAYASNIKFHIVGTQYGTTREQLGNFKIQLKKYFGDTAPNKKPRNWLEAFNNLTTCLEKQSYITKPVIFIDELQWLAESSKKKFIEALGYFWNNLPETNKIVVVICGSAASWIINNLINTKGGMHNRVTRLMHLKPFTLRETKLFLESKNVYLNNYHTLQLYMAFGGIPYYLEQIESGKSAAQIIQEACFDINAPLMNEFNNLYKALFSEPDKYINVITALKTKWSGLTRQEIIQIIDKKDGGSITNTLKDLVQCDFIIACPSYEDKKSKIVYRLLDEYSLFYLSFCENYNIPIKDYWLNKSMSQEYKSWCGYAFENICFRHQSQIVESLNLSSIFTKFSSFYSKGNSEVPGTQIDLVMERGDNIIHLFEIKFHQEIVFVTKDYSRNLRTKLAVFKNLTNTKKQLFVSMISVFGIGENEHSNGFITHSITADDLFEQY